jgi:hypothetical protein
LDKITLHKEATKVQNIGGSLKLLIKIILNNAEFHIENPRYSQK